MKVYELDPKKPRRLTSAEARRMESTPIDYSEIPALGDEFFAKTTSKQQLTIRLDTDILTWLKGNGRGYQTRINGILRAVMESQPPKRKPASAK
jgi:uncharacterized protein (DUF4415 family)